MTDLFDADGYPTTEALDRLRTFDGTASDMLELITELFRPGGVRVERGKDENLGPPLGYGIPLGYTF